MTRRPYHRSTAALCAATLLLAAVFVAALTSSALAAGAASPLVFTAASETPSKLTFSLDRSDKRALAAQRRANRKRAKADEARRRQSVYAQRIEHIEDLVLEAQESEGTLRLRLQTRLVDRYKQGAASTDELAYLLAADSLGEAIQRSRVVGESSRQDSQLVQEYSVTAERLAQLEQALGELKDAEGDRALALEQQATGLDGAVAEARERHVKMSVPVKMDKQAGIDGTWLVSPGGGFGTSMLASTFGPQVGGSWNGGANTPRRPPNAVQVGAILNDPRIDVYAGGRIDIASGRIDGRVIDAIRALAERFGSVRVTSLISGHGVYTASGNISMHSLGCAVDIGSVGGTVIQPSTQGPSSITEQSVLFLAGLPGDLQPHQVISLNSYGGPTLAMGDHHDHIHLGFSC